MDLKGSTKFFSVRSLAGVGLAIFSVAATTGLLFLIGRDLLGEGVIALLYLAPVSWGTARWGQAAGVAASITAALAFNFFFIPPFYTLYIGSLEGWLLLLIFLAVAILVVGRIQSGLARAQAHEREASFLYALSAALAGLVPARSVARILAEKARQLFQAELVQVYIETSERPYTMSVPEWGKADAKPDLVLPLLTSHGLEGEVRLWKGSRPLPDPSDRLLQNFTTQAALALDRQRQAQAPQAHSNGA